MREHFRLQLRSKYPSGWGTSWLPLQQFLLYRMLLAGLLLILQQSGGGPQFLGAHNPQLFAITGLLFLLLASLAGLPITLRKPDSAHQAAGMVIVDTAAITLLMHASGGVTTGLGMLLLVSVAIGSALTGGRAALAFASMATLATLTEQLYAHLNQCFVVDFVQAGLLGAAFFAIAVLTRILTNRLQRSEQQLSQQQIDLADLEQLNEYVIQHMPTGVVVVDAKANIRLCNEPAWRLLDRPKVEVDQPLEQLSSELAAQLTDWQQEPLDESYLIPSPQYKRELQTQFTYVGERKEAGILILFEDASAITRQAQQMKLASLGRLTASIAHEIRNPLGAISHAQQLLAESDALKPADRRLSEIIQENARRMNEVVESVLQISRKEALEDDSIELSQWCVQFCESFTEHHGLSSAQVRIQIAPEDTKLELNETHLRQILTNLFDNALAHFGQDSKTLQLQLTGGIGQERDGAYLKIVDNGPGIAPEIVAQMFEPFVTTRSRGTGLGLYLANELCAIHQWKLSYFSPPKGGSGFQLRFFTQER